MKQSCPFNSFRQELDNIKSKVTIHKKHEWMKIDLLSENKLRSTLYVPNFIKFCTASPKCVIINAHSFKLAVIGKKLCPLAD